MSESPRSSLSKSSSSSPSTTISPKSSHVTPGSNLCSAFARTLILLKYSTSVIPSPMTSSGIRIIRGPKRPSIPFLAGVAVRPKTGRLSIVLPLKLRTPVSSHDKILVYDLLPPRCASSTTTSDESCNHLYLSLPTAALTTFASTATTTCPTYSSGIEACSTDLSSQNLSKDKFPVVPISDQTSANA